MKEDISTICAENYLRAVFVMKKKKDFVRNKEIAEFLGYTRASVSVAIKRLIQEGYLLKDAHQNISFTEKGQEWAERIYEKNVLFTAMLCGMGVDRQTAEQEACRMEHAISDNSFQKVKLFLSRNGVVNFGKMAMQRGLPVNMEVCPKS